MDIKEETKKIVKRIGMLRNRAETEKRAMTEAEADEIDGLLDELDGFSEIAKTAKMYTGLLER